LRGVAFVVNLRAATKITAIAVIVVMIIFFTWGTEIAIFTCIPLPLSGKEQFG
jgi:hypothetical protein